MSGAETTPKSAPKNGKRKREDEPPTTSTAQPEMRINFADTADQRTITITHSDDTNKNSFTFNSSTSKGLTVNCGKLRILITNTEDTAKALAIERTLAALPAAPATPPTNDTEDEEATPPASKAPRHGEGSSRPNTRSRAARRTDDALASALKKLKTSTDTPKSPEVEVDVEVRDYKRAATYLKANRRMRVKKVIRLYAAQEGLDAEQITFSCFLLGKSLTLDTRLGLIVDRSLNWVSFRATSTEDPEYDPYSDDSDEDK